MLKPSELLKNTLGLLNTPGNIITAIILFCGAVATVMRFGWGIGAVTNLDDYYPWGLWIGFDLLCGVALASWVARVPAIRDGLGASTWQMGLIVFGEWPDLWTWAGSTLVVAAGIYTIWREAQIGKVR